MRSGKLLFLLGIILTFGYGSCMARAATAVYAIAANNVTMPSTGMGSSQYSVTSIPLTGTLVVTCQYTGPTTVAKIPTCSYGPIAATPVTAGQALSGTIYFYPFGSAVPVSRQGIHRWRGAGLALAGALLLGFGLRRRSLRCASMLVLVVGVMALSMAIGGCGSSVSNGMTPGTYAYTITADNESGAPTPLGMGATTTIMVTVP